MISPKLVRSIAASEQLYNAGFENLFWVQGGLEAAEEEVGYNSSDRCICCFGVILSSFFFRISSGKVPSLSSLLVLVAFLNFLGKFQDLNYFTYDSVVSV
jgi:hypothetical protein